MKDNLSARTFIKKISLFALLSVVLSCAIFGIVWMVRKGDARALSDTLFIVGLPILLIGLMACMKGGPNTFSWLAGRTTRPRSSKQSTETCEDYKENSVLEFRPWRIIPLLTGALVMLSAVLVYPPS